MEKNNQNLENFIMVNTQNDLELRQILFEYFKLYKEFIEHDSEKAAKSVFNLYKMILDNPNRDLQLEIQHKIEVINMDNEGLGRGLKRKKLN